MESSASASSIAACGIARPCNESSKTRFSQSFPRWPSTLRVEFPLLANRSLYVCVQLASQAAEADHRFAVIPLGKTLPRILTLPTDHGFSFALLEDVVRCQVQDFFPGEEILSTATFRITRNADISLQEDAAADLLHGMQEMLQQRKTADCVRLEIDELASGCILEFLQNSLQISHDETILTPEPIDLSFLMQLAGVEGFDDLRNEPWPPQHSPAIDPSQSMFATIADKDLLLSHPYESYEPVVRFVDEAADDADVLAIKQTLYRTSRDSAIVNALRRAAERGKYVTTIVELKARFDEARNIEWARELEEAGVQGYLWREAAQDACQGMHHRPPGAQRHCSLHALRNGQLQRVDGSALQRHQLYDLQ